MPLVFKRFPLLNSHYLILPRVSSLVVWGLGVSAPTPKTQGLISGQEQRFHMGLVMALSEIKTISQSEKPKMNPRQISATTSAK